MSAEEIATVVADLRSGRIRPIVADPVLAAHAQKVVGLGGPVVDATALYRSMVDHPRDIAIYEDHNAAPPWDSALVAYRNEHGNVIVMALFAFEHDGSERWEHPSAECRWADVRWIIYCDVFVGGASKERGPFPTSGPAHAWGFAVYGDGEIADIRWFHLVPDYDMNHWDMAMNVTLGTLTFLTCRNVELVEPKRSRAAARRIARTGVHVHELAVFPTGKTARNPAGDRTGGSPLTSVRGHWAKYGPEHGRGLLFGKLAGRFWIPTFARGDRGHGESVHDYRIEVDEQA